MWMRQVLAIAVFSSLLLMYSYFSISWLVAIGLAFSLGNVNKVAPLCSMNTQSIKLFMFLGVIPA